MRHREGSLSGVRGLNIYHQSWRKPKPRGAVVIAHGLGEHSGRYRHVAEPLVNLGFAVYLMDHRGHGRSAGPRAFVDRFDNAVADIDQVVDLAASEQRNKPLFLLGHSMGGGMALSYAIKHQDKLTGLILSGPAVALDGAPPMIKPIARFLSRFMPRLGLFPIDPSVVSRDPASAADYAEDPLNCHGKVPARTLGELVNFVDALPAQLPTLTLPLLVMHGGDDKLAGVAGSQMVIQHVSSADKTLKVYDGLYHEIFNEFPDDRERVLADLCEWLDAHAAVPDVDAEPPVKKSSARRKRSTAV